MQQLGGPLFEAEEWSRRPRFLPPEEPGQRSFLTGRAREQPRSWSADRRSRPARSPSRGLQASPRTRTASLTMDVRDRGGHGDLRHGLSDGDIGGVRPTEAAYRSGPPMEAATFGDYGPGRPPGLEVPSDRPARDAVPGPIGRLTTATEAKDPKAEAGSPSPLDVLITGMSQLQQVLLKQKAETMDLEPKAVQELAKLPEYTPESGATDFQDYLYLAEQQIGSLASGAGDWWLRTLRVAQKAYAEYQSLSPMKRLSVQVTLPEDLKDDKYKRLERKVASLMLGSLPRGVRDELVAHRVQGVHQILFRLMIVFQPGGAQDRAQLLRQLDVSESSPGRPRR